MRSHELIEVVVAAAFGVATGCDGRIYLFGGLAPDGGMLDTVQLFDPPSAQWFVSR
jgi:hypothetical protein